MTLGTHVVFASVLYLGGATLFGYRPDWIGRLFFWVSVPLERRFGHRTITHSLVGLAGLAVVVSPLWFLNPLYFWCVVGGYWSHLWLDMLNIRKIDQRRVHYLNGEIQTARIEPVANIDRYQPVIYSGQTMTLRYARAQELGPWLDLVAAKGEVFVQFWLRPGERAVFFEVGNEPPEEPIPGELRGFL
ncbi:MAG: metal-dependent hydrolase [Candidatus Contendobacter sp.]|nr:metal-dependent hydrolase [Candidatus Contendobacter sp.]MDG4555846.1 metal-dependent hydrolase [Candidatus Contendobacter sp.]